MDSLPTSDLYSDLSSDLSLALSSELTVPYRLPSPQLRALARDRREPSGEPAAQPQADAGCDRCELCAEPVGGHHRHLYDLVEQTLLCACQACSILFDGQAAGGHSYRLVPRRRRRLDELRVDGTLWAGLGVPVDLAFFVGESTADAIVARYPSPGGTIRHVVPPASWQRFVEANPVLAEQQPDIEAVVVNHARGATDHWMLPLDDCYRLTALLREHWRGFNGGDEVWAHVQDFFLRTEEAQ